MVAVSLLFRYANFVSSLGGSEEQLGIITGLGMTGGILARCVLGQTIDRYGAGRIWRLSLWLLVSCLLGHLAITSLQPPFIHLLRILYTVGLAGAFGSSITFVSLRANPSRMGEMIGMLGSSGFIGMGVGPKLGDWLLADVSARDLATNLFGWSAGAACASLAFCLLATWRQPPLQHTDELRGEETWLRLVLRYHPGWTLLVGCAMGLGIGMPGTFLSAFAEVKGIEKLSWFWTPYAIVAFLVRVATRQLSDRWGTRPTIILGLLCLAASMFSYLLIRDATSLLLPAACGGLAHAFLFPAAVAEGNHAFPTRYRGMATTLMLMMFDIGLLVGQPLFGWTVEAFRHQAVDGYAVAFGMLGAAFCGIAAIYATRKR